MTLIPELEQNLIAAARRRSSRRRLAIAGAAMVLLAGSALAGVGLGPVGDDGRESDSAIAGDVSPALSEQLGVFRRPRTPRDELPGDPVEDLRSTGDAQPGEDPSRSRRIDLAAGTVYLWPMRGGVCNSWGSSGGCIPVELLRERGVATATSLIRSPESGEITRLDVMGVAVDDVRNVRLIHPGKVEISTPIKGNVFWVDLSDVRPLPSELRWEDGRGEHSQSLEGL